MNLEKLESYVDEGIVFKEEEDGFVVYNCGDRELCKIVVYSDGSYICNFDRLCVELDGLLDSIVYARKIMFDALEIDASVLVDDKTGLRYFNNKNVMNVIKNDAKELIKQSMNKDSFIKAHIYHELIKIGYEDDLRLTDVNTKDNKYFNDGTLKRVVDKVSKEIYIRNVKYKNGTRFDGDTMVHYKDGQGYVDYDFDEIIEIIQNVFGTSHCKEIDELFDYFIDFDNKNEANYIELFSKSDYVNVVSDMLQYAVIQYEKQYSKYISDNVKINFTLKQAYSVLSDEIKNQLAEEIFYGDSLETKFISDIVNIFSMKCSKKDKKKYDREEIVKFLVEKSANRVTALMPEDFDVFKDLGKVENEKIVDKYDQMAEYEVEDRRSR